MSPLIITLGLVEFLVQRKKTFFLQPTLLLIIQIYEIEKILKREFVHDVKKPGPEGWSLGAGPGGSLSAASPPPLSQRLLYERLF